MKKLVAAALTVMVTGLMSAGAFAADKIKIGAVLPMTGSIATFGESTANGIKMAFDEVNKAGGVRKKQLELVIVDSKGESAESANAINRVISAERVTAIIGDVASSCTLAGAPIAQASGIPMITSTSTNVKVTQTGDYIFRACFIDDFQGEVMANFASKNLKATKVAMFTAISSDYSKGLSSFFKARFTKLGGKIVAEESYSEGDQDFSAQLTKIKAAKPDAIYVPGYYTEVASIARQASQLGLHVPLLGGDGFDSTKLYEIGGDAIVGSYFSNHYSEEMSAKAKKFLADYKARYGKAPDALAALGYDAALIMANAVKKAKNESGAAIKDALAKTNLEVVTGKIKFDSNRNPIKSAVVLKVEKGPGNYKYVATIKP